MPQVPTQYSPIVCPVCGRAGMPDVIWKCPCGKYTHYPYNAKVEREMHSPFLRGIRPRYKRGSV